MAIDQQGRLARRGPVLGFLVLAIGCGVADSPNVARRPLARASSKVIAGIDPEIQLEPHGIYGVLYPGEMLRWSISEQAVSSYVEWSFKRLEVDGAAEAGSVSSTEYAYRDPSWDDQQLYVWIRGDEGNGQEVVHGPWRLLVFGPKAQHVESTSSSTEEGDPIVGFVPLTVSISEHYSLTVQSTRGDCNGCTSGESYDTQGSYDIVCDYVHGSGSTCVDSETKGTIAIGGTAGCYATTSSFSTGGGYCAPYAICGGVGFFNVQERNSTVVDCPCSPEGRTTERTLSTQDVHTSVGVEFPEPPSCWNGLRLESVKTDLGALPPQVFSWDYHGCSDSCCENSGSETFTVVYGGSPMETAEYGGQCNQPPPCNCGMPVCPFTLGVEPLLQTDPQWHNDVFNEHASTDQCGVHPCTIGYIGCSLTSFCMAWNHLNKSSACTPSALNTYLKNTPHGFDQYHDPYWPTACGFGGGTACNAKAKPYYVRDLADSLKSGTPVIVKLRKPSTRQNHFVVVTGTDCEGNFTIDDPTSGRGFTTLQDYEGDGWVEDKTLTLSQP